MKTIGKFFKWVCIVLGALVIFGIAIAACSGGSSNDTSSTKTEQAAPTKKVEPVKADPVTKENYDKIKQGDSLTGEGGMTIEEVVAILGEPDSKSESSYNDGTKEIKIEDYSWTNLKFNSISVSFTNGHVSNKFWSE